MWQEVQEIGVYFNIPLCGFNNKMYMKLIGGILWKSYQFEWGIAVEKTTSI